MTAVRRDLQDKIVVEHKTDLETTPILSSLRFGSWIGNRKGREGKREFLTYTIIKLDKDIPGLGGISVLVEH